MVQQLNVFPSGQVIPTALHTEMQQSYLEYAMSVIVGRALPDVRDGLKPVHRRILYAMHELGLTPDRPFRKCARVVGDVLGKYHPHGDQAVYDALVRMVQEFSSRYPLLGGHGNFGSVDDDPPAAMRYTETRLSAIGNEALLTEIADSTVDFTGNFDNSQQEPLVLPSQLPLLLLNGSSGIAVGMATNIPPHNLGEIVDGLIALIDNPNLSIEKLIELIPGPDFPTAGEIVDVKGIWDAYTTGRGSIPVRGVAQVEEVQTGRGKHRRTAIIVTELPFQVCKSGWIEKMAELVTHGRLEGVADIRDESDRDGIRVVIELKRDISPQKILNLLYRQTALQSNFGVIMLALDESQPRQMSLKEMLQRFLDFREETLTRRYRHAFTQAETRRHSVEGLLTALDNLDAIIDILRNAPDGTTAKVEFQRRFELSDRQANDILAMPLRRLTGIERTNLQTEFDELTQQMAELQKLLSDRRELLKALKKDLRTLKKKFGDERRTRILAPTESSPEAPNRQSGATEEPAETIAKSTQPMGRSQPIEKLTGETKSPTRAKVQPATQALPLFDDEPEEQETVLEITQRGYTRRFALKAFQRQLKTRDALPKELTETEDFAIQTQLSTTGKELVVMTRSGKAYAVQLSNVPQATARSKGSPLITLLPAAAQSDPQAVVDSFILPTEREDKFLLVVTQQGRVKRLPLEEFVGLTGRGLTAIKLKDDDQVAHICQVSTGEQLVLATSNGRMLRVEVNEQQLPSQSRTGAGQLVMRLSKRETVAYSTTVSLGGLLLMVTEKGYAKRMPVVTLRLSSPGDLGAHGIQLTKTDALVGLVGLRQNMEVAMVTTRDRLICPSLDLIPMAGRDVSGENFLQLNTDEKIAHVIVLRNTTTRLQPGSSAQEADDD
jgi:DNA gyrase subunit A